MTDKKEPSEPEKQFIENEIEAFKADISRQLQNIWNGGRCKDCGDKFGDDPLNMQSRRTPSICCVCHEYRSKEF